MKRFYGVSVDADAEVTVTAGASEAIGASLLGLVEPGDEVILLEFDDDLAFCRHLISEVGVAAIPTSFFWHQRRDGRNLVGFCFCKRDKTREMALERLAKWRS